MRSLFLIARTPILLGLVGVWLLADAHLVQDLVLWVNYRFGPGFSLIPDLWHLDYFLFPPNTIVHLAGLILGALVLERRRRTRPRSSCAKHDAATLWWCLLLALLPVPFTFKPVVTLLLVRTIAWQVGVFFVLFALNADLFVYRRLFESRSWFGVLSALTFPVTDLLLYASHGNRIEARDARLGYAPLATCLLLLGGACLSRAPVSFGSIEAEKISWDYRGAIQITDTYYSRWVGDTLWFTNNNWDDATAGIWTYDANTRRAVPFRSIFDAYTFEIDGGFIYTYDRLIRSEYIKVDMATNEVVWATPVEFAASYETLANRDSILASGEEGRIYVLDKEEGSIKAYRKFPTKTDHTQIFSNGHVVYIDGNPVVHYLDENLELLETIHLPEVDERPELRERFAARGYKRIVTWTYYSRETEQLYVTAMFGKIHQLDLETRTWVKSYDVSPGVRSITVDETNGLIFAAHYVQGYVDVLDLETGEKLASILAAGINRYINIDPVRRTGIVHTNGRGIYRFDYSGVRR